MQSSFKNNNTQGTRDPLLNSRCDSLIRSDTRPEVDRPPSCVGVRTSDKRRVAVLIAAASAVHAPRRPLSERPCARAAWKITLARILMTWFDIMKVFAIVSFEMRIFPRFNRILKAMWSDSMARGAVLTSDRLRRFDAHRPFRCTSSPLTQINIKSKSISVRTSIRIYLQNRYIRA
ncbi:hypothetical protein EVAR_91890_1 [Eumeta japonica]|uniref:Uncharacterized protein n=1 Tax=Eumeta variegata TaxID=151549 RepID=A0A4C1THE0_EUMVA|nr:hypothetical protein EVAR_91890_1 [Eumeta japonica]